MKQIVLSSAVILAFAFGNIVPLVDASQRQFVSYKEHGAVGNGVADDFEAIIKAHAAANAAGLPVKAEAGATYYIGASTKAAEIQTNTDWSDAKFIIDDSKLEVNNRNSHVFNISSKLSSSRIRTVTTLKKNQLKIRCWGIKALTSSDTVCLWWKIPKSVVGASLTCVAITVARLMVRLSSETVSFFHATEHKPMPF